MSDICYELVLSAIDDLFHLFAVSQQLQIHQARLIPMQRSEEMKQKNDIEDSSSKYKIIFYGVTRVISYFKSPSSHRDAKGHKIAPWLRQRI